MGKLQWGWEATMRKMIQWKQRRKYSRLNYTVDTLQWNTEYYEEGIQWEWEEGRMKENGTMKKLYVMKLRIYNEKDNEKRKEIQWVK